MSNAAPEAAHLRRATVSDAAVIARHRAAMFRDMGELDDDEGILRVSLHASDVGRRLYEQLGFQSTNEMRLQLGAGGRR